MYIHIYICFIKKDIIVILNKSFIQSLQLSNQISVTSGKFVKELSNIKIVKIRCLQRVSAIISHYQTSSICYCSFFNYFSSIR